MRQLDQRIVPGPSMPVAATQTSRSNANDDSVGRRFRIGDLLNAWRLTKRIVDDGSQFDSPPRSLPHRQRNDSTELLSAL